MKKKNEKGQNIDTYIIQYSLYVHNLLPILFATPFFKIEYFFVCVFWPQILRNSCLPHFYILLIYNLFCRSICDLTWPAPLLFPGGYRANYRCKISQSYSVQVNIYLGTSVLNPGAGFLRIFTVALDRLVKC